jgi:hypothetical protein
MASYPSASDAPSRPGIGHRSKTIGTNIPPPVSRPRRDTLAGGFTVESDRGRDQTKPRQGELGLFPRQSLLPKPRVLDNTPVTAMSARSNSSTTTFGFRRPPAKVSVPEEHQLRTKSSRNVLRRKPSTIGQQVATTQPPMPQLQSEASSSWPLLSSDEFGSTQSLTRPSEEFDDNREPTIPFLENSPQIIPELDRYRFPVEPRPPTNNRSFFDVPHKLATHDLPPPTPLNSALSGHSRYSGYSGNSGYSASPSTRFSESPGPGPYSRDTTPTSMSSQSPGVVAPLRTAPRLRQQSPIHTRPPVTRRRMGSTSEDREVEVLDAQGLPSLRESLTSSSSNSTVKGGDKGDRKEKEIEKAKKKKKRLSPLPPSPPPRKSSQKFKKSPGSDEGSPSKPSKSPARPVMNTSVTSPLSQSSVKSPLSQRSVISPSSAVSAPPRRPSRDGTPDLQAQLEEPIAIVQSNLTTIPFSSDKRSSASALPRSATQSPQVGGNGRPSMQSRLPSRSNAPSPSQQIQREATPAPAGLGIIPDLRPVASNQRPGLRTPSPTIATPKPRFGLFSRRAKTAPLEAAATEKKEKPPRKGPMAGTGHEGYGRYALRGRSSTIGSRERSQSNASSDSLNSRTADPFLLERMSPVIIAGGGEILENYNSSFELTRTDSDQSLPITRPSMESKGSGSQMSYRSNINKEAARTTLWPSALPRNAMASGSSTSLASKGTFVSDSSDNDSYRPKRSLAARRSLLRLKSNDSDELNLPMPIRIPGANESSGMSSKDTSYASDGTSRSFLGKKTSPAPKKLMKRPKSPRKWNFFQRSQTSKAQPDTTAPIVVSATTKQIAYYEMVNSSEQEGESPDIEDILREVAAATLARSEVEQNKLVEIIRSPPAMEEVIARASPDIGPVQHEEVNAPFAMTPQPTTPIMDQSSTALEVAPERPHGRPSRLAQVGRIPRVVTARPEQSSPMSFSRPFARISMMKEPPMAIIDPQSIAVGPSPNRSPSPEQVEEPESMARQETGNQDKTYDHERPFLVISPRKDSKTSTSSSSGAMSFVGTTAVIPKPDDALEEDEIWDEYDDLIGDEDGDKVPPSATSSRGVPFQYESFETRKRRKSKRVTKEWPVIDSAAVIPKVETTTLLASSGVPSHQDLGTTIRNALGDHSPTTPMSFSDFISGYGDRNSTVRGSGDYRQISSYHVQRDSRPISGHSKSASMSEKISGDLRLGAIAEQVHESPLAQVNLRVGSMTVSKWLTFGHVLFSPARDEIMHPEDTRHHSILVIDGLGNGKTPGFRDSKLPANSSKDDWSFYAAETYPEATFYNLSPSAPRPSNSRMSISTVPLPAPPPNHRQIQHNSLSAKLPFTPSTFTIVVLRFPPASPETLIRHLVSESKRVLKPAGYLEMSILDLDMMNMGNRTRRAVREMKIKISTTNPDISLASASDTVLRLVGKKGFGDIKSCMVGVPVASMVSSAAGTTASGQASIFGASNTSAAPSQEDISLAELMRDPSAASDEGITKMVAKVGRWWYSKCYESVIPEVEGTRSSVFGNEKVLDECEKWGTSFKLLVCYAQKPAAVRRRTASV